MFHCRMVQFVVMVPPKEVHSMLTKFMMNTKGWYHHVSHGMKWLTRSRKVANAKTRKRRHQEEQADKNNKTMMIVVTTSLPEPMFPPSCGYFLVPGRMCSAPKQAYWSLPVLSRMCSAPFPSQCASRNAGGGITCPECEFRFASELNLGRWDHLAHSSSFHKSIQMSRPT